MAAARPAAVLLLAALCLTAAAATRDAAPLRALRTEEGNIDDLISKIQQLQQQKRQQTPTTHRPEPTAATTGHPQRQFAYYPSDPEYRAPRPVPLAATRHDPTGSAQKQGAPRAATRPGVRHVQGGVQTAHQPLAMMDIE
ncbi:uncharacterized protein LOC119094844 [Pollicipes pollicipes]|uniref:uncharacterized protein LOC119094844 n=1 Tax=Pollicipes pollicipes TaxID=41117 RepID=UPI001885978E|nr:uncharacterized protein LOC119094844 [Pollicipes pollicipes]